MENKRNINTYLDPQQWAEFETVQRFYGIDTNADVVRFLIRKEARLIVNGHTDHPLHSLPTLEKVAA